MLVKGFRQPKEKCDAVNIFNWGSISFKVITKIQYLIVLRQKWRKTFFFFF